MLYRCLLSWCFAVPELQCVSTLSQFVRMQDILCQMGWLLSAASILPVVVGFLYTLVASRPDSSRVTKTSKNAIWLFCSNSLVNCMSGYSEFNWFQSMSTLFLSIATKVSLTYLAQSLGGQRSSTSFSSLCSTASAMTPEIGDPLGSAFYLLVYLPVKGPCSGRTRLAY